MLDDVPEIPQHLTQVWYAFRVLSSTRTMGFSGPNPITIDAIFTIADHLYLDRDEALFFILGLDEAFMDEVLKKRERESKMKTPPKR